MIELPAVGAILVLSRAVRGEMQREFGRGACCKEHPLCRFRIALSGAFFGRAACRAGDPSAMRSCIGGSAYPGNIVTPSRTTSSVTCSGNDPEKIRLTIPPIEWPMSVTLCTAMLARTGEIVHVLRQHIAAALGPVGIAVATEIWRDHMEMRPQRASSLSQLRQ